MRIKIIVVFMVLFPNVLSSFAQSYFQQQTDYKIDVTLNDVKHTLKGDISITYKNNSPDTLSFILVHLWPNAYKDESTSLSEQLVENGRTNLFYADDIKRGFIDSLSIKADGKYVVVDYEYNGFIDICKVNLINPLLPGATTVLETPFRVKIPDAQFSRLGHIDQAYFITQWYPKPAVYDLEGWHEMPYLDQGEFYSEFGRFEVAVTLPSNYVIGGSGQIQEQSELNWLLEKSKQNVPDTLKSDSVKFPLSSSEFKTVTFIQDSIHDFAWFADKRFEVLIGEFVLNESGRKITSYTLFTPKDYEIWRKAPEIIEKSIKFLSDEVGEYPYNSFTAVDGTIMAGGGMEYPMATILNTPGSAFYFETTLCHEICHSWFYGILGNNERVNAWMDEGFSTYYENKYQEAKKSSDYNGLTQDYGIPPFLMSAFGIKQMDDFDLNNYFYRFSSFNNHDQIVTTQSDSFTYFNYGAIIYGKSPLLITYLQDYLGEEVFKNCINNYYNSWKFSHPSPGAVKQIFEKTSGKDLSWFFDDLLNSNRGFQFSVKSTISDKEVPAKVKIKRKSGSAVPLKIENEKGEYIWTDLVNDTLTVDIPFETSKKYYINKKYNILFKSSHNSFKPGKSTFRLPKLKFGIIPDLLDEPGTEGIYFIPVPAWNRYNGWMAGALVTNMNLIPEKFEFSILPLYDFSNSRLAGTFNVNYNLWPYSGPFSAVTFSVAGKQFAFNSIDTDLGDPSGFYNYSKIEPSVNFDIRKKIARSTVQQSLQYRYIAILQDEVVYTRSDSVYVKSYETIPLEFHEINYRLVNSRKIDPYSIVLTAQKGNEFVKISAELNYKISYKKHNKGIDVRFFTGTFVMNDEQQRNYNFRMSGWEGSRDYLYDEIYFGRSDDHGLWDNQFVVKDGGFKIPTFLGQTNKWLASMNVCVDLPFPLPVSIFADIGTYEGISDVFEDMNNKIMYNAGLAIKPIKNVFEIYIPFIKSDDIKRTLNTNNINFSDQIRFVFNLKNITPKQIRNRTIASFQ